MKFFSWIENHEYFSEKLNTVANEAIKVEKLDDGTFKITDTEDQSYTAKFVLLCTGIMDTQPEIQGSIKPILPYANKGDVDYCIRCDGHKVINKISATIGHTKTAAWVAALLHERYNPPELKIFLNGKKAEWEDDTELNELIKIYNIKVIPGEILSVKANEQKDMQAFEIQNNETNR